MSRFPENRTARRRRAPDASAGWDRYRRLLAVPGMPTTLVAGFLVKLPVIAIPLVLSLQVSLGLHRSLGAAGLVTGAWMAGVTAGAPVLGWAMDRLSTRPVLTVSAAAQGAFWATADRLAYPALLCAALASGLLLVPGSTLTRMALAARTAPDHQQAAFALDTVTSQLSYLVGPALGVVLSTQASPATACRLLGIVLVLALAAFAVRSGRPSRPASTREGAGNHARPGERKAPAGGDGRTGAVGAVGVALACAFATGTISSGFELSLIGLCRAQGAVDWAGLLIAACAVYAALGGLLSGTLAITPRPAVPLLLLGLVTSPLGLAGDWRVLLVAIAPAAMLAATSFAVTAAACGAAATEHTRGRVLGLYGAAVAGGNALGAPLAGLAMAAAGPASGFLAAGTAAVSVALACWVLAARTGRARPLPAQKG
ncbi:MFS transporter [Streptomyces lavenduligriseus]|uniref:MFS transporter n=1 Tax=Streptomyces lavenduligriseus TaxID=67315 RepID=A0ABT0P2N0_9ACTN|nr:MFS transporter [Streptomyces lavenduligriseus]MCL3997198.1 MFS transporter [Streptomyces lavenduligriseus]